jgi:cell division protein FtsB
MENKHTLKLPLRISEKNECSICDSNDNFIIETFETETAEFIVTACNNYQALKAENTLLKEVNEAQIFTIEKYQKENEELKEQIKTLNDIIDKAIEKNL